MSKSMSHEAVSRNRIALPLDRHTALLISSRPVYSDERLPLKRMPWNGKKIWAFQIIVAMLMALTARKFFIGYTAMRIVESCRHQVLTENIVSDKQFLKVTRSMSNTEPTLILILNQHALNMTLNWLCNTEGMPDVHERALIVALDREAYNTLGLLWPNIRRFYWNASCLERSFNYGDGYYHLFFLFRSNLVRAFVRMGKPVWMVQQDTVWRKSLFDIKLDQAQEEADIVFDRATDNSLSLVAGGYYKVRPTCGSRSFFEQLSARLERHYVPDNAYMTTLCDRLAITRCEFFPFQTIATWKWFCDASVRLVLQPYLLQFDGEKYLGGKLATMKEFGFYFLGDDGRTCNASAVSAAMESGFKERADLVRLLSYSRIQFGTFQILHDLLYKYSWIDHFIRNFVLPYAHYFMITI